MNSTAQVVICGAGIAGVATAYQLAVKHQLDHILLIDERPPLTLTSDKSTECYRNFWPAPDGAMVQMMNRSIDLLEAWALESHNIFHLNRRGYVFATADPYQAERFIEAAGRAHALGAGPARLHRGDGAVPAYQPASPEGFQDMPTGADVLLDPAEIQAHFPVLARETCAVLHIRRAGWLSAQQLGVYLLEQAQAAGVRLLRDRVETIHAPGGRIQEVRTASGRRISTGNFVNAAGPLLGEVARMLDLELPVYSELHLKAAFQDHLGVLPREMPMLIWGDPQQLAWSEEERLSLAEDEEYAWTLETLPSGVHTRPEGAGDSQIILLLWEYNPPIMEPQFPPPLDPIYPEIVVRGLSTMIPRMVEYIERLPRPVLDGGYYTKTRENRPLAGPLPVAGAHLLGALSGFGIMSAPGLSELVAAEITGSPAPEYAPAFHPKRYENPAYLSMLDSWSDSWQL